MLVSASFKTCISKSQQILSIFLIPVVEHIRLPSWRENSEIFLLSNWIGDIMRISGSHINCLSIPAEGLLFITLTLTFAYTPNSTISMTIIKTPHPTPNSSSLITWAHEIHVVFYWLQPINFNKILHTYFQLLNLHGKTLVCYVLSLLFAYCTLAIIQFNSDQRPSFCFEIGKIPINTVVTCTFSSYFHSFILLDNFLVHHSAFVILFWFMAAFCWQTVMCVDIWLTFG